MYSNNCPDRLGDRQEWKWSNSTYAIYQKTLSAYAYAKMACTYMHHADIIIDVVKYIIINKIETLKKFLLKSGKWTRSNTESIYHF